MTTLTTTTRPPAAPAATNAPTRNWPLLRWVTPTLADALFILLLLRVLQLGATNLFNDPGTGWHLRTGHNIVADAAVPLADTFSYTRAGEPWVATQWLADAIMSLTFATAGYTLLALGTAVLIAGLFRWIYRTQITHGSWPAIALLVTFVAAGAASGHFLARPLVATSIGVPLCFWWATQYGRGHLGTRRLCLLVPIAVLWCNLHPGVLGGIATVGLCAAGALIGGLWRRTGEAEGILFRRGLVLAAVALAMAAATLVNPYGPAWHAWIAKLMTMKALSAYVTEWRAPGWNDPATIAGAALLAVTILGTALRRSRTTAAEALVIAFWAFNGFGSGRHLPLMAMVLALQLGRVLADLRIQSPLLSRVGARVPLFSEDMRAVELRRPGGLASLAVIGFLLTLMVGGVTVPAVGINAAGPSCDRYSAGAVAHLQTHAPAGGFFNDLNYGGTLIQQLPGVPVFADDRFGLYGEDFVTEYRRAVLEPDQYAAELLDRYAISTVLIASRLPLCEWLTKNPEWVDEYDDTVAAVFTRVTPMPESSQ